MMYDVSPSAKRVFLFISNLILNNIQAHGTLNNPNAKFSSGSLRDVAHNLKGCTNITRLTFRTGRRRRARARVRVLPFARFPEHDLQRRVLVMRFFHVKYVRARTADAAPQCDPIVTIRSNFQRFPRRVVPGSASRRPRVRLRRETRRGGTISATRSLSSRHTRRRVRVHGSRARGRAAGRPGAHSNIAVPVRATRTPGRRILSNFTHDFNSNTSCYA